MDAKTSYDQVSRMGSCCGGDFNTFRGIWGRSNESQKHRNFNEPCLAAAVAAAPAAVNYLVDFSFGTTT